MLEKLEITELTSKNSIEMLEQYKEETKRVKEKADDTIHLFLSYLESQGELIPVLAMESLYQLFMSKLKYKYHHEKWIANLKAKTQIKDIDFPGSHDSIIFKPIDFKQK